MSNAVAINSFSDTALKAKEARKLTVINLDQNNKVKNVDVQMPTYKVLPIKDLSRAKYQREPKRNKYIKIAKNLDMDILGVPLVSYRPTKEGNYWIIDGQHRCSALEYVGVKYALCQIIEGLTIEQEAEKYLKLNTERTGLNANQKFMGKLGKKDLAALDIVSILERNGFTYATNTGLKEQNKVACLSSCYETYSTLYPTEFENVFRALRTIWNGSSASVHVQIIRGLAGFIKPHAEYYDFDILCKCLKGVRPEVILDKAAEMDDRKGKARNAGGWKSKSNYIFVSKQIWKEYEKYCKENGIKSIPWMFD